MMKNQLSLFPSKPVEPFRLEPSPSLIVLCKGCGRQIIVRQCIAKDTVMSEYRVKGGLCWGCCFGETDSRDRGGD